MFDSFEKVKIKYPTSEIYTSGGLFGTDDMLNPNAKDVEKCHPADHCMTVEQFLKAGHKFVEGDVILRHDGKVITADEDISWNDWNILEDGDDGRYILRAAALEKPKRVKVEYVKVDLSLIEKIEMLKSGERLHLNTSGSTWICEKAMKSWDIGSLEEKDFYRRIETEITERDEFIKEVEAIAEDITSDSEWSFACIATAMFDSGKFKLVEGE